MPIKEIKNSILIARLRGGLRVPVNEWASGPGTF